MVGWNEDEYTFFAMAFQDTVALKAGFTFEALQTKLETQFGNNTKKLLTPTNTACLTLRHQIYG